MSAGVRERDSSSCGRRHEAAEFRHVGAGFARPYVRSGMRPFQPALSLYSVNSQLIAYTNYVFLHISARFRALRPTCKLRAGGVPYLCNVRGKERPTGRLPQEDVFYAIPMRAARGGTAAHDTQDAHFRHVIALCGRDRTLKGRPSRDAEWRKGRNGSGSLRRLERTGRRGWAFKPEKAPP